MRHRSINWTGFYLGGHAGGGFSGNNISTASCSAITTPDSSAAYSLEPTISSPASLSSASKASTPGSAATRSASIFPAGFVYSNNQRGLGSITGRLGYSWGPALFYAKGGYAYSSHSETLTFGGAPIAFTLNRDHDDGYTVGAGIEYLFTPNWSAKAEYQYYDFGKQPLRRAGRAGPVRHLQQRRAHPESRRELSLQPRFDRCKVLSGNQNTGSRNMHRSSFRIGRKNCDRFKSS